MTAAVASMLEGKRRADSIRQAQEDRNATLFLQWVKIDASAHARHREATTFFGHESVEAREADERRRRVASIMPAIPTSASIKRVLGEES